MLFDVFVIPSIPQDKQMTDSYKTIQFLQNNGITKPCRKALGFSRRDIRQ